MKIRQSEYYHSLNSRFVYILHAKKIFHQKKRTLLGQKIYFIKRKQLELDLAWIWKRPKLWKKRYCKTSTFFTEKRPFITNLKTFAKGTKYIEKWNDYDKTVELWTNCQTLFAENKNEKNSIVVNKAFLVLVIDQKGFQTE